MTRSARFIRHVFRGALLACSLWASAAHADPVAFIDEQIAGHPGLTGAYVLDRGEDALRARAWLTEHARASIEVQYFIWSTDNIGKLAAEALCARPSAA